MLSLEETLNQYTHSDLSGQKGINAIYLIDLSSKKFVKHILEQKHRIFQADFTLIMQKSVSVFTEEMIEQSIVETHMHYVVFKRLPKFSNRVLVVLSEKHIPIGKLLTLVKTTLQKVEPDGR